MLSPVTTYRLRMIAALFTAAAALAACAGTTNGTGDATGASAAPPSTSPVSTAASSPSAPAPSDTALSSSASESDTVHPVPSAPLRTATVHAGGGTTYVIKVWAEVPDDTCFDHAYGQPMITFLTKHPCGGMTRLLATTTVNGHPVGFAEAALGFHGTAADPYKYARQFRTLVEADGTGNINDLLREGYRLPAGPTVVPSPDAFSCVGQDEGVTVWDVWYLDRPTPNNDPPLVKMTMDAFLQF
jgi:hypothetical protein